MNKSPTRELDPVYAIFYVFIGFLLVVSVAGFIVSGVAAIDKQAALEADQCKLTSSLKTGKSVYCGKACLRPELRKEYQCKSGIKVVIE